MKRQFVQRSLNNGSRPGSASFDPLDPASIAARQRAARQMREGLNSAYGTSTRGTEIPQGAGSSAPGGGGGGGAAAQEEQPIISDPNQPKNDPVLASPLDEKPMGDQGPWKGHSGDVPIGRGPGKKRYDALLD
jgi:hypothetical protein